LQWYSSSYSASHGYTAGGRHTGGKQDTVHYLAQNLGSFPKFHMVRDTKNPQLVVMPAQRRSRLLSFFAGTPLGYSEVPERDGEFSLSTNTFFF